MRRARLAADIGGTFTDVVLEDAGQRFAAKVLTTPRAPEDGMLEGIAQVLRSAERTAGDVGVLIHGTTLATNALIERAGARTAFVTTAGFRDVLEMGYEKRYEHYDLNLELPAPLVPRELRFPVAERITARGEVHLPLAEDALLQIAASLRQAQVEAVAVGFLHAYANDAHERRAGEILAAQLPGVALTLSAAVCPEIREYERFSTACANAYVQPLMARYLGRLAEALERLGLRCPLYLMTSGGGLTTLETARRFPVRLIESGPAGGAILSACIARDARLSEVLSFDMGGTTAKICFIGHGRPEQSRKFEVARVWRNLKGSGLPVRVPVTEMVEIGAGGGSIARLDALGRIRVGPQSAGAEPGPVCYRRGGAEPTVTDANVVLGRIDPGAFAGGTLALDRHAAERAVLERIGGRLKLDANWAAAGIGEIVEENMASAARVHAIERGKVAERCTMIAFGGAAPLHAANLAAKLGMTQVLVPLDASVGSAIGFLRAPMAFELVRSFALSEDRFDAARVNRLLEAMAREAQAVVAAGAPGEALETRCAVEMRHAGQGHEIAVPLPDRALAPEDGAALREAYQARYEEQFGLRVADVPVEYLSWSVTVSTAVSAGDPPPAPAPESRAPAPRGRREVFDAASGKKASLPAYWRAELAPGARLAGPALVAEPQTTTLLPAGWSLEVTAAGHLLLTRP
ncbi:MAG: hydantoinase/oxoprolinase family protein [Betaproteobacteria bacterium]|nr:MAG: hydantoinase/oxoprolinase family protein [Betaproteobacteria bacterium]